MPTQNADLYWLLRRHNSPRQLPPEPMNTPRDLPTHLLREGSAHTLGQQLAGWFGERIRLRALTPGARLPSVRACAHTHGVSPSTVVAAYDLLQAQGLVEARRQRGFFVRDPRPLPTGHAAPAAAPVPLQAPVDATALIRGMFQRGPGQGGPGLGTLPEPWLDGGLIERALRRAIGGAGDAMRYGDPAGDPPLREALARRLAGELGIAATAGQIVTTVGATQALDIVARTLLRPGDAVLVDDPGWAVEFARFTQLGMRLLPVPRGPQGPDLTVLEHLLRAHRPRLYATVSVLHNPTGQSLSLAAAHQVLKLADAHDLTIVEDDTYAWLAPPHAPRLSALDGLQRTVYVSGFSKILAPNWRVGYAAASPALAQRLIDTKLVMTLTSPALMERAVAWCLDQGLLRRHAERVAERLQAARPRVTRLAADAGCRPATPPQGLFGWVDTGVDADALAARMAAQGWLLAPGSLFHAQAQRDTHMRINFASSQDPRFWQQFAATRRELMRAAPG